ncbi:aminotransferase class III-fold pyridoxal phosphate-dependent enzyme [Rhodobacter sp. KR11]|uniref:aminotransferase class III-fold pyridoxal phosphate-dependent enzyme n=1 Tax=Rhodobacter sp. KR11 TaxID=2974588 RepID=UPI002221CF1E|nr:aminotransferase class III-fold pyridoxal phosphate-dependent enzyme [Rhodobacter sp. KR11]MCW1918165.1 aminotransferase class III-fold pyridoxal phosphate-dependent enzyme [Rhodobacter sp. KR11]
MIPNLPNVTRAKGSYLWDATGKRYIDGSGGPAVYCLGHAHPEVNEAVFAQMRDIAHGYRYNFTTDALESLTAVLRARTGMAEMVFVSSGSEAVESCLKIALQYHTARGEVTRRRFISRERSWHGNTLGALGLSGFAERTAAYEGAFIPSIKIPPANAYRPGEVDPADALEAAILQAGAENVAGFVFEPVVGAAGGCVPAPEGYAARVREICTRYGVLMIADEVMCGAGRCGTWRALEHDGVSPDLMSVAKGLAGGYVPLGAALCSAEVWEVIAARDGAFGTGHTFTGHTAACAAALAVQRVIDRDGLLPRVAANGDRLKAWLGQALADVEWVGDIRGRGHFICAELVADRVTKEPFDTARKLHLKIRARAMENGLICYPVGGNVDGKRGDIVILAPPYNATDAELVEIIEITALSIRQVLDSERIG